jgi:hypothetical protein
MEQEKNNRYNFLSVMDHSGHYIFACLSLGAIDKDVFIGSALYLHEGDYFFNHDLWQQMVHLRVMAGMLLL